MGFLGKLLSTPFKIVNAPLRAAEDLMSGEETKEGDRIISKPLDALSNQIEKVDE